MKKILLASLLATASFTTAGLALADSHDHSGKRSAYEKNEMGEREENGLSRLWAKLGMNISSGWDDDDDHHHGRGHHHDDDDDDDNDHEHGYGKRASAPVGSTPVPDNGLFVPGSKPSVNMQ